MSEPGGNWVYFAADAPAATALEAEVRTSGELRPAATQQCVMAIAMHLEGRSEDAIRQCYRGIERGEHLVELYGVLAQIQFELGRHFEAAQAYQKQLLLDPKHPTAWYNLGLCQERMAKWKEAADSFRKALESEPTREPAVLSLGTALLQLEQYEHALVLLDDFLGANPRHMTALWGKAAAFQKLGRLAEADELYRSLTPSPDILTNRLALYMAQEEWTAATQCALALLEAQAKSRPALEALASLAFQHHNFEEAARYCTPLAEVAPSYEAWFNLGFAQHRTGDLPSAAHAYQQAIDLKPNAEPAHANLGTVFHEQGRLDEARTAYERALRLVPDRIATLWNFALLLEQSNLGAEAERQYLRVTGLQKDWEEPWLRIGHLRFARQEYKSAIEAWQQALELQNDCLDAHFNLALSYWRAGESSLATEQFEKILSEHPDFAEAARCLTILAMDRRNLERALHFHTIYKQHGPPDPDLTYNVALMLQEMQQTEQAAELYQQALKARPNFVEALVNLGHACQGLDRPRDAKHHWDTASRIDHHLTDRYLSRVH